MSVEFGIGYHGVFSKYRVFESYAWMHHIYGELHQGDGNSYDAVIPNYFDPADFPLCTQKEDYYLYVGRLVLRKGLETAVETTRRLGVKLKVAGQGVIRQEPGKIVTREFTLQGDHIEYVGTVDVQQRGLLMGRAKALFAPTLYIGPFEGVSVEALFCGTPVITTDWGCFAENNIDGTTGYRVRTLGESMWAAKHLDSLASPSALRDYAIHRFSLYVLRYRYEEYFNQLLNLWGKGWYSEDYAPIKRNLGGFC
jgi:glycosyltransferase involved in cell wall biosynthesis